jgi:hypothetical protein
MRLRVLFIIIVLLVTPFAATIKGGATPAARTAHEDADESEERTIAVEPDVVLTLCMAAGQITVRGWDKREVRASARDASYLGLRSVGEKEKGQKPASHVEVIVSNDPDKTEKDSCECDGTTDIELDVPKGATIELQSRESDIEVSDVAYVEVKTNSGEIDVRGVSRGVEVETLNGEITLANSTGRVRLHTVSGDIDASNIQPENTGDAFEALTTSGEIRLDRIGQSSLVARTTSGSMSLVGPLARGGSYQFNTTSGDVTLIIPGDSSFRITASIHHGNLVTDFNFKSASESTSASTGPLNILDKKGRFAGVYGTGDASLDLISFSGTVRLRRK